MSHITTSILLRPILLGFVVVAALMVSISEFLKKMPMAEASTDEPLRVNSLAHSGRKHLALLPATPVKSVHNHDDNDKVRNAEDHTSSATITATVPANIGSAVGLSGNRHAVITWRGRGSDHRWSKCANWEGGHVPGESDVVRFTGSASDVLVDARSSGIVAGLVLEPTYSGTLSLNRDLIVNGDLVIQGGSLNQGDYSLSARQYNQSGGTFTGGRARLTIAGDTTVRGGTLTTPSLLMTAESLVIDTPGVVRMAVNGKLELSGSGKPLRGGGLLDTTTNRPNSVEYTGRADGDLTTAGPARGFANLGMGRSEMMSKLQNQARKEFGWPASPLGFGRSGSLSLTRGEDNPYCAVIDPGAGFAYFGAATAPGVVVKIRLSDFKRVGALTLNSGESYLVSAVIDLVGGFAYFATATSPGTLVKVRLSDFMRVSAVTFNRGEDDLYSAVIDPDAGFAYFGTATIPGIVVKVRLSDFTRVASLTLNSLENSLYSAVIDPSGGFAYFGTGTAPGVIVKVRLSNFTRVAALTLNFGENYLITSVIDLGGGFAYFGGYTDPGIVVKVRLSDFTRAAALTLNPGEFFLVSAVIDPSGDFAYFGTDRSPGTVVKVRLSNLTREGALTLNSEESPLVSAVIDPGGGFAYFGTGTTPGIVVKVRLSDFTRIAGLTLTHGENNLHSAVIDPSAGFAYFGANTIPAIVVKVRLSDFTRVGVLTLDSGLDYFYIGSAVIDPSAGFAYFATGHIPGIVVKLRLSDFTRVAALTLDSNEYFLTSAVIDPGAGFAYFGTSMQPASVVKVRLSDFTRVGAITFGSNEGPISSAVIDPGGDFAYFGIGDNPGVVVKVRLSDFTRQAALTLNPGESFPSSAVIDTSGEFAYFGTYGSSPAIVVKLRLSDFSRVGALTLNPGENNLTSAVIDSAGDFAYFGTGVTDPGIVVKVRLLDFARVDALTLNYGERDLSCAVIDQGEGFAYFGTDTIPGVVVRIYVAAATPTPSPTPSPTPTCTLQFSATSYTAYEGDGQVNITVTRSGDTSGAAGVRFSTSDATAKEGRNYTTAYGVLNFAPGETSKTFTVLLIDNAYVDGDRTVNLALSNPTGAGLSTQSTAVLTIKDNDVTPPATNPLDTASFFVLQHYFDFLSRYPDQRGWDYWTAQITQCGLDAQCIQSKRIDVSNAFFYELEYQQTSSYVYRLYRAAFGNDQPFPNPNPDSNCPGEDKKMVAYQSFAQDRAQVVGGSSLAQSQSNLANAFVQRTEFLARYPLATYPDGPSFVDAVLAKIKNDLGADLTSQRQALIDLYNQAGGGNAGRGYVLYRLADDNTQANPINNRTLIDAEYNRAFVFTQYAGYLRRDSDIGGFVFWLGQANSAPLRDVPKQHAMVCSFITSIEYQLRFSSVVTHSNSECPQ